MGLPSLGIHDKMKIIAFNKDYKIPISTYVAMFNPQTFSEQNTVNYVVKANQGTKEEINFENAKLGNVSVTFLIDGTGAAINKDNQKGFLGEASSALSNVLKGGGGTPELVVQAHITAFKATVDGMGKLLTENHEPPYLILQWGKFIYKCRCLDYNITYSLFSPLGLPIRATITANFIQQQDKSALSILTRFLSPDLTKSIIVKEGDTLPLLADREYGDSSLYLELARANNLTNIRNIKPGTILKFPPIDKNQQ